MLLSSYFLELKFYESRSDSCLTEMLGSGKTKKKCLISDSCYHNETKELSSGDVLTHQALYFLIGETHGKSAIFVFYLLASANKTVHKTLPDKSQDCPKVTTNSITFQLETVKRRRIFFCLLRIFFIYVLSFNVCSLFPLTNITYEN